MIDMLKSLVAILVSLGTNRQNIRFPVVTIFCRITLYTQFQTFIYLTQKKYKKSEQISIFEIIKWAIFVSDMLILMSQKKRRKNNEWHCQ